VTPNQEIGYDYDRLKSANTPIVNQISNQEQIKPKLSKKKIKKNIS